jgi:hypothetical protein
MSLIAALLSAAALIGQTAPAPTPAPQAQTTPGGQVTDLGDVEVNARRETNQQRAQQFVDTVATSPAGARLARWDAPVCISVAGMRGEVAQAIIDRIADVSTEAGIEIGTTGCAPNVLIIATDNGRETADALVANWRSRFRPPVDNTNMGLNALERFRTSDAAVRWWHLSAPVDIDTGMITARVAGDPPPQTVVRNLSRTRSQSHYVMAWVTVVLDLSKIDGVPLPALADYLAMVSMAQVDPRSDYTGQETILNLFQDPANAPGEMTDWDHDYLKALYTARTDRATATSQEQAVANELARNRTARENAPTPTSSPN